MGLIRGLASFSRYRVKGALPDGYPEVFGAGIERHAFRPIDEHSDAERSAGWVNILDMFDTRFAGQAFLKEPYLALAWRLDVRSVPKTALGQQCREAETRIMEAEGLQFLPKARRLEIKERLKSQLLRRAIPRSRVFDVVWDLQNGVLLFGCLNPKLGDEFAEGFRRTFELDLFPLFPYSQACRAAGEARAELVDRLAPAVLGGR